MKYLKIKSKGEISIDAFTIIGNSTKKDNDDTIGMFGSGLKYAISAMLRNHMAFQIFTGLEELIFETKKKSFRTIDLDLIYINNEKTSFTTAMGDISWDKPFAPIREIYSNALDEDENTILEISDVPLGEPGYTVFYLELTDTVKDFYENRYKYFCTENPEVLFSNKYGSVYKAFKNELRLFRKGILIRHDDKIKTLFNYNSSRFKINESRVESSSYTSKTYAFKIWRLCNDEKFIEAFINSLSGGNAGVYEHTLNYNKYNGSDYEEFTNAWHNVVLKNKYVASEYILFLNEEQYKGRMILPLELLNAFKEEIPNVDILGTNNDSYNSFIKATPSIRLSNKLTDAINILSKSDYKDRYNKLDINVVNFMSENTLGLGENNKIYLSTKLEDKSVDQIAKIIIEENEHNKTGYSDMSRPFQNHLFSIYYDQLIYGSRDKEVIKDQL